MQSHHQYSGYFPKYWRLKMMFRLFLGLSKGKKQTVNDLALKILIQHLSALQIKNIKDIDQLLNFSRYICLMDIEAEIGKSLGDMIQ